MTQIRVILYQKPLGVPVTHSDADEIREYRPHFVCFPEFFFTSTRMPSLTQTLHNQALQKKRIETLSRCFDTIVIGGTMPELDDDLTHNTCYIYDRGKMSGFYRKKNLFFAEVGKITPGDSYKVFSAYGITFSVMICADIFDENAFSFMRDNGVDIIFSPTFSLHKDETPDDKFRRDNEIYVSGARASGSIIVKVCGVKSEYKNFLQARSLVASPEGILYRVAPDEEEKPMIIKKEIAINKKSIDPIK